MRRILQRIFKRKGLAGSPLVAFESGELLAFLEFFKALENGWRFYREYDDCVELWAFISTKSMVKKKRYLKLPLPYPDYGYPMSVLSLRGYSLSIDELSGTIQISVNCRVVARIYRNRFDAYTSEQDKIQIQLAIEGKSE